MISNIYRNTNPDNSAFKRKRQIDTLKVFNANVSEVTEDSEYKVDFVSGNNQLAIIVLLSPEFPLENPVLKVVPAVNHPWVEESGEITGAPGLLNFTVHSDLGRVVQAIVREFELRPPPLISDETSPPRSQKVDMTNSISPVSFGFVSSSSPPTSTRGFGLATSNHVQSQPIISTSAQPVSVAFPELNSLTVADLELLNTNVDRLDEFVDTLPVMKEINRNLEDCMTGVEELAKENLSKESRLQELKKIIQEKSEIVAQLRSRHEALSLEYQKLAEKYSPQSIRECLKDAVMKSDEESERIAEQFLNKEMDLDEFLVAYIQRRMASHSRRTKEEKLSHQLQELERAGF